jgi:hypothetical protein
MANPLIKVKRSETASAVPTLTYGELGVNITDKKIFVGSSSNVATLIVDGNAGGSSTTINATNDTATTTLYPIMVGALGSAQTVKARSTTEAFAFNASTNILSAGGLSINKGALGTTATNTLDVVNFTHTTSNVSYLKIKATRNAAGADWTTASTKLLQVIDATEMGYIEYNPNGATFGMAFGSGATEWARFLQGGNFGIGTTNPISSLDIVRSAANIFARNTSTTNNATIAAADSDYYTTFKATVISKNGTGATGNIFGSIPNADLGIVGFQNNTNALIYTNGQTPLIFATNSTERARFDGLSGNLGIANNNPAFKADIAGDARVTSTNKMRFGGTAGTTNFYIQYNSTANSLDFVAG